MAQGREKERKKVRCSSARRLCIYWDFLPTLTGSRDVQSTMRLKNCNVRTKPGEVMKEKLFV
jgi:hypothetical protein